MSIFLCVHAACVHVHVCLKYSDRYSTTYLHTSIDILLLNRYVHIYMIIYYIFEWDHCNNEPFHEPICILTFLLTVALCFTMKWIDNR